MSIEVIKSMRAMAWAKVKGELEGITHCYWGLGTDDKQESNKCHNLCEAIDKFIQTVEYEGWVE